MKILTFLTALLCCSLLSAEPELVDKIVATVSSETVLRSDVKKFPQRLGRIGAVDETLLLGEKTSALQDNPTLQLEFLIREKILESEIKRLGLGLTDSQLESEMNSMAKRGNMTSDDFKSYLSEQGYSIEDYKKVLKNRLERQTFFEKEIISKLRITDDDALNYYKSQNPNVATGVSEFKVAQIFFSNKVAGAEKAAQRALAAYEKFQAGESFESLANQLDETPGSNRDGFLGSFKAGEFIPEIEKEIISLKENQVSRVVRGPNGFHIVKLLSKTMVQDPRFLKVKDSIKAQLVQQNFERQLKNWFETKKSELDIKVYDKAL